MVEGIGGEGCYLAEHGEDVLIGEKRREKGDSQEGFLPLSQWARVLHRLCLFQPIGGREIPLSASERN